MGCSICTKTSNNGLIIISEPSISEETANLKVFSLEKAKEPLSSAHSTSSDKCEKIPINVPISDFHRKQSIRNLFPATAMLKEINNVRMNPLSYIDKIEHYKKYITTRNGHTFLLNNNNSNKVNINLHKGIDAFNECISFLKNLSESKVKLSPLIMKEELKIPFPINSPEICTHKDYLKNILQFKTEENREKFRIIDFHYDICYSDIELSTLLQIVDDTNSNYQRRKNIFNPKARYVGITEGSMLDSMKCYYLLFAE